MSVDGAGKAGAKGNAGDSQGANRPVWAREVWRMAFGDDASKLSLRKVGDLKTLPKAVRDYAASAERMTAGMTAGLTASPGAKARVEVEQGTWKGEAFYKVTEGPDGQNMLIDARGKDFLSMMEVARPAVPDIGDRSPKGAVWETMHGPPKGWSPP